MHFKAVPPQGVHVYILPSSAEHNTKSNGVSKRKGMQTSVSEITAKITKSKFNQWSHETFIVVGRSRKQVKAFA